MRGENPLDRTRALLDFIDQLAPGDFEGSVAHFRSLGITDSRMGEYGMLLSAWAKADSLAALAYAKENTGNPFTANTVLTTWASIDPEAAIRWAQANHTGDGANPYLAGIIRSLAASDPILHATRTSRVRPFANRDYRNKRLFQEPVDLPRLRSASSQSPWESPGSPCSTRRR
jgi:hypothetical protein